MKFYQSKKIYLVKQNAEVLNKIREYLDIDIIKNYISVANTYCDKEIALSLEDEINKKIEEVYEKYYKEYLISVHEVYKAFNWALISNDDLEIINVLGSIVDVNGTFTMKQIKSKIWQKYIRLYYISF